MSEQTPAGQTVLIDKCGVVQLTSLSVRTIERMISKGRFPPPLALGGKRMWHRAKLEAWLAQGCRNRSP
jgi:predicted DNA-binding transcriptional regulator AlpA